MGVTIVFLHIKPRKGKNTYKNALRISRAMAIWVTITLRIKQNCSKTTTVLNTNSGDDEIDIPNHLDEIYGFLRIAKISPIVANRHLRSAQSDFSITTNHGVNTCDSRRLWCFSTDSNSVNTCDRRVWHWFPPTCQCFCLFLGITDQQEIHCIIFIPGNITGINIKFNNIT